MQVCGRVRHPDTLNTCSNLVCRSVDVSAIWIHLINVPSGVQVCGPDRHLDTLNKCSKWCAGLWTCPLSRCNWVMLNSEPRIRYSRININRQLIMCQNSQEDFCSSHFFIQSPFALLATACNVLLLCRNKILHRLVLTVGLKLVFLVSLVLGYRGVFVDKQNSLIYQYEPSDVLN